MTARAVRLVVIGVCVLGIAGMIVTSILDSTGGALTFGLVTAVAILCLMVATAVTGGGTATAPMAGAVVEAQAERVEHLVQDLAAGGVDEAALRDLVREAVRLGRTTR